MAETEAPERYVRPPSAESEGRAPGRGRLVRRRILIVGGGQQVVDAATDPVGNGRAMSILFAREGAHVCLVDRDPDRARETLVMLEQEGLTGTIITGVIWPSIRIGVRPFCES